MDMRVESAVDGRQSQSAVAYYCVVAIRAFWTMRLTTATADCDADCDVD